MSRRVLGVLVLVAAVDAWSFEQELETSVAAARWDDAQQILDAARNDCGRAGKTADCTIKVTFSQAWVDTEHANVTTDQQGRKELLVRARDGYQEVLKQRPGHSATTDNLIVVLQQLGDVQGLGVQMQNLRASDPKKAARVARLIADSALASGNAAAAFDQYAEAFSLRADPSALSGMVDAFSLAPADAHAAVLLSAAERTTSDPDASIRAFQAIAQHPQSISTATWDTAALRWVEMMSVNRRLTARVVGTSFDLAQSPVFAALDKRLNDAHLGAQPGEIRVDESLFFGSRRKEDWWTADSQRSQALALAGWSAGYAHLLENDPAAAEATWLGALHYAPNPLDYSHALNGQRAVMLDLLTDLARIDVLMKAQLDPDGSKFAAIERALFDSKASAYQVNDLLAIQRHHTLLGKMYADLGRFEGTGEGDPRSARFQLSHALSTAAARAKQTGVPDPQPALAALLADGYRCALPKQATCRANPTVAAKLYTDAATGFLDLDALDQAKASVAELKKVSPTLTPAQTEIETIIQTRSALRSTGQLPKAAWLEQGAQQLPVDFVARQQFKALSDSAATPQSPDAAQNAARAQQILQANPNISGNDEARARKISAMGATKGQ